MKTKNTLFLFLFLFLTVRAFSDVSIMAENARDYRNAIDELILDFIQTEAPPKLDKALRIQAYENNMLSLARLDPASARNMPNLLLANEVRLRDLRNLPGELIVARAREAGVQVLEPDLNGREFRYEKGLIFKREKTFSPSVMSSEYPRRGDWVGHYGYALQALRQGDYEEAAQHFEFAAVVSKVSQEQFEKFGNMKTWFPQPGLICLTDRSENPGVYSENQTAWLCKGLLLNELATWIPF